MEDNDIIVPTFINSVRPDSNFLLSSSIENLRASMNTDSKFFNDDVTKDLTVQIKPEHFKAEEEEEDRAPTPSFF